MDFQRNTKLDKRVWLSLGRSILFLILIFPTLTFPNLTHANVFTNFISSLFSPADASAQTDSIIEGNEDNSQTMALLESSININPTIDACSDSLLVETEDALLSPSSPSISANCEADTSGSSIINYVVREGDTYSKIAEMFDVSVNTILWYNNLSSKSTLKVGQTLYILPISGVMYTVASGDTLSSIAKKTGGDINEIASYNGLKISDKLAIGDSIMIPDGQAVTATTKSGSASKSVLAASGPSYSGYYIKPFLVGHKTQGLHGHNGVDYGMPVGSPLYAAAAGVVITSSGSGWNGGYGSYVVIKHPNGTQTWYAHMSNPIVTVGQSVDQGQTIGYSGNTGKSTGPHLHFEIHGAKNPF